jgi:single-stranded DNA-binding protein
VGRLGRDPETRYTADGQAIANFSMKTFKDKNSLRQSRPCAREMAIVEVSAILPA